MNEIWSALFVNDYLTRVIDLPLTGKHILHQRHGQRRQQHAFLIRRSLTLLPFAKPQGAQFSHPDTEAAHR